MSGNECLKCREHITRCSCGEMESTRAPKFQVGDIVRTKNSSPAIFVITMISANHAGQGQHRYYGETATGVGEGRYEEQLGRAGVFGRAEFLRDQSVHASRRCRRPPPHRVPLGDVHVDSIEQYCEGDVRIVIMHGDMIHNPRSRAVVDRSAYGEAVRDESGQPLTRTGSRRTVQPSHYAVNDATSIRRNMERLQFEREQRDKLLGYHDET